MKRIIFAYNESDICRQFKINFNLFEFKCSMQCREISKYGKMYMYCVMYVHTNITVLIFLGVHATNSTEFNVV